MNFGALSPELEPLVRWSLDRIDPTSLSTGSALGSGQGLMSWRARLSAFLRKRWINLGCRMTGGIEQSLWFRHKVFEHSQVVLGLWSGGPGFDISQIPPNICIGRYCSLGLGFGIATQNHPFRSFSSSGIFYEPSLGLVSDRRIPDDPGCLIGHDVWLGLGVSVTPGCRAIGHGSVVGAGSVVTRDVPPLAVVAGNPARFIKWRFSDPLLRADWLRSRWWLLPPASLERAGCRVDRDVEGLDWSAVRDEALDRPEARGLEYFDRLVALGAC